MKSLMFILLTAITFSLEFQTAHAQQRSSKIVYDCKFTKGSYTPALQERVATLTIYSDDLVDFLWNDLIYTIDFKKSSQGPFRDHLGKVYYTAQYSSHLSKHDQAPTDFYFPGRALTTVGEGEVTIVKQRLGDEWSFTYWCESRE